MSKFFLVRRSVALSSILIMLTMAYSSLHPNKASHALPSYARQYGVPCSSCHTVVPALNDFGKSFEANHFNWPGTHAPLNSSNHWFIPISGLTTFSSFHDISNGGTTNEFNTQELFASHGFTLAPNAHGGYFVDYFLATNHIQAGGLGDAYVTLPVDASRHRTLSLTVGQDTPLSYQYEENNSLSQALPAGLSGGVDGFSEISPTPMLRLEYADGIGHGSPDGIYVAVGVPFQGALTLNSQSRLYSTSEGYFLHAYQRRGATSFGAFGFVHTNNSEEGLIGTDEINDQLHLLGAVETGSDAILGVGSSESLEADYTPRSDLGLTVRLDSTSGFQQSNELFPVATITYYPFRQNAIRLIGETIQEKAARSAAIYLLVQL